MRLADWLNSINMKRGYPMDDPLVEKEYSPFIINKCLSYFPDTILYINEMNANHHLPKKMQFDYLHSSIRKRKRFSPWMRKNKDKKIEIIKQFFSYSDKKAEEIVDLLPPECFKEMKRILNTGGIQK